MTEPARPPADDRPPAYDRLTDRFARIATIGEAGAVLGWDAAAMMPPGGGAARGDQLAVLAGLAHGMLAAAEAAGPDPGPGRAANLRLMRRAHTRATALPADLVEAQARANSKCEKIWREAKSTSNFKLVQPHLAEVVNLVRQQATALGQTLRLSPYDALMDGYQRGTGAAEVASIFGTYERFLMENLPQVEERQAR